VNPCRLLSRAELSRKRFHQDPAHPGGRARCCVTVSEDAAPSRSRFSSPLRSISRRRGERRRCPPAGPPPRRGPVKNRGAANTGWVAAQFGHPPANSSGLLSSLPSASPPTTSRCPGSSGLFVARAGSGPSLIPASRSVRPASTARGRKFTAAGPQVRALPGRCRGPRGRNHGGCRWWAVRRVLAFPSLCCGCRDYRSVRLKPLAVTRLIGPYRRRPLPRKQKTQFSRPVPLMLTLPAFISGLSIIPLLFSRCTCRSTHVTVFVNLPTL